MPRGKRSATTEEDEASQPAATQKQSRRGRRSQLEEDDRNAEEEDQDLGASGREEEAAKNIEELTQRYLDAAEAIEIGLTPEETDKLVAEVMRLMLFKNGSNQGVPVKRDDILAVINKNYKDRRGLASHVITLAQAKFVSVFGMEMKEELRRSKKKGAKRVDLSDATGQKTYFLRSLLPLELRQRFVEPARMASLKGLGAVVLCLIHLAQDTISETLHNHLSKLGVKPEDTEHPAFGNIDAALQTLCKQRLIEKVTLQGDDPEYHYVMGDLAQSQIGTERLERMIKTVMGDAEQDMNDGADD